MEPLSEGMPSGGGLVYLYCYYAKRARLIFIVMESSGFRYLNWTLAAHSDKFFRFAQCLLVSKRYEQKR
ncbi:MAG: hypothetical protein COB36_08975 [Alphaproteobacteria bacterium]|nr:MAG: hypothetical protein COB36_08975 [Alphaproteobacteria bacterium]